MDSSTGTSSLRLTGSLVAQYFRFRCDRQLRWQLVPDAQREGEGLPRAERREGMRLLSVAGRRFERRMLDRLLERVGDEAVRHAGRDVHGNARVLEYARVVETLRDPGPVRWLVQPELAVPPLFAARFGVDPALLELAPVRPDLVRVGRTQDGRLRPGVCDVKWSRHGTLQHFAQVAFYSCVLEEALRHEGIDAAVDRRRGWIWTRGARRPRPFPLAAYRHHVEEFLRDTLPRVAAGEPGASDWHLSAVCAGCGWFGHCRGEAERTDHLARVAGVTPVARELLRSRGLETVRHVADRGLLRKDTFTGCHALEAGETRLKKRVQALRFGRTYEVEARTHLMGPAEGVRILLSAEPDPVSGTCFALGVRVERNGEGQAASEVFVSRAGSLAAEREMLAAFLARVTDALAEAAGGNGPGGEKPVHFYLWDAAELESFRGLVERHLSSAEALPAIAALAGFLFPPGDGGWRARSAALPGTVVVDAVSELFALPVPYAYDLAGVSAALQPEERPSAFAPRDDFAWPLSSQVAFERIHDVWSRRPHAARDAVLAPQAVEREIRRTVAAKLAAMDSVVRAVREKAARGRPALLMDPAAPPYFGPPTRLPEPSLEKLRVFTELEAAEESLAVRALHTLPTRDRARRFEAIAGVEPLPAAEQPSDHEWVFTFDPACREAKFRPGDFALVLTNDDGKSLLETDRRPALRRKLSVELVKYDLAGEKPRVVLASDHGFPRLEKDGLIDFGRMCVLDRAEADFNTRRVLATLRALAAGEGAAPFVVSLLNGAVPPEWLLAPLDPGAGRADALAPAAAALGRDVLNAEQEAAWRAVFERAVSVVWGPPGTGKTYLLAWMLIGLAAAARRARRPLRVAVTAGTHRAIATVLRRVDDELRASGIAPPLRAVKLRGRGSEADEDLEGTGVEVIADDHLPRALEESDATGLPLVVGSTVWSLWKQMRAMNAADPPGVDVPARPLFDVVVLDESSQMKVADALIALSSIRRGGRVVLAGDDRQLAPIVRGSYPAGETLFGSAFRHFAARFGRLALRESRRMNDALVRYPRRLFYPGFVSVVPDRKLLVAPGTPELADPVDTLLWETFFRPEDAVLLCTYDGFRATARNPFEAGLVARLARLARAGLLDPATGAPYTAEAFRARALAVISPHRAQNSAVLGELLRGGWPYEELPVVDTVERMQGNEREMIVVSYAVADREYAEREAEFLLDPHRFNVSITRARSKLVLFVSDEVLRTLPRDERVMADSLALKGYPRHFPGAPAELTLPAPDGTDVRLRVFRRSLRS